MEVTDSNIETLCKYLENTLHPEYRPRKEAENFLESIELNQNYPVLLLNIIGRDQIQMTVKVASAIAFKNFIKRNWSNEQSSSAQICDADREAIKNIIVQMMLTSPPSIQKQLSDAVSIIGKSDFPDKWPNLFNEMDEKFATGDFTIINGILQTAHSLFKKYRYEFRSNQLFSEIKLVLDKLAAPITTLMSNLMAFQQQQKDNVEALKIILSSINFICKIFYSLNFQDLPEFFEDNMATWMNTFHELLSMDFAVLKTADGDEPTIVEMIRSQICENLTLYVQKYGEEFKPFLQQFVTDVWNLLINVSLEQKYDLLVTNALQFLSSAADQNEYRSMFEDAAVLGSICEKVILPNIQFRDCDQELFEDNSEEYIRRDIEGSDVDTRRRSACNFLNKLSQNYEQKIMDIFSRHIQVSLSQYQENPDKNWRNFDAAICIIISLVSRGKTQRHGVTQISALIDLSQFFETQVLNELQRTQVNQLPVLKADCIKYLMTFRSVLPNERLLSAFSLLIKYLNADSIVVHSYAACAIQQLLDKKLLVGKQLSVFANDLINGVFGIWSKTGSEENDYAVKALMRAILVLDTEVIPFLGVALPKLSEKMNMVAKNPSKPNFNHFLFEAISLCIKIVCKTDSSAVASFENILFPFFQMVLQQDIQEFIPYVFQLLALLLQYTKPGQVSNSYLQLFPILLTPPLWEKSANASPLVHLLSTYILIAHSQIQWSESLNGLLGIFQKLIASKLNDHEGFNLIQAIMKQFPVSSIEPYVRQIFFVLFQRLSSSKTTKYVTGLIVFFSFYIDKYSAKSFIEIVESIQANMFGMVTERVFLTDLQKISDIAEKCVVAKGIIHLLNDQEYMINGRFSHLWPSLFEALLYFFEMPVDDTKLDEDFAELLNSVNKEYEAAYSRLSCASVVKNTEKLKDNPADNTVFLINQSSFQMLKAVILIGGPSKGTRFRPLSLDTPKPLFPVAGQPVIQHHIEACSKIQGVTEVLLIGSYQKLQLVNFLNDIQHKFGINVRYLQEYTALGTAGALYHFRDQIRSGDASGFFVMNGDVCADFPLDQLYHSHITNSMKPLMTIMSTEATRQQSLNFGCMIVEKDTNEVLHYVEKPSSYVSTMINCGVYFCTLGIFQEMSKVFNSKQNQNGNDPSHMMFEMEILTPLAGTKKLYSFISHNWWSQLKTANSTIYANRHYLHLYSDKCPERLMIPNNISCTIIPNVFIDPSATIHPSAIIGPNVSIGPNVKIGAGVRIRESIILSEAFVDNHSFILYGIIGQNSVIGKWSRIEGTPSDPDPNKPFAKMDSPSLFNKDGRLNPSTTILGCHVTVLSELIVLNTIVLPYKELTKSIKNEIIL